MRSETGYPGMKVLHFAFDAGRPDNEYLPHNIGDGGVVYAGTHDNDTTRGWWRSLPRRDKKYCLRYMRRRAAGPGFVWDFIGMTLAAGARLAVITMQDYLGLGGWARMNRPGKPSGNWVWRARKGCFTASLARRISGVTELYGRRGPGACGLKGG
jgi:4-alpha-glucanotransferase